MMKLKISVALGGALVALSAWSVAAQEFPTGTVRITSPFPTGSGPDVVARLLADKLQTYWNQPVLVDARPGANGVIAIDAVKRAKSDGHDLVILDNGHVTINPSLFSNLSYDVDRDLDAVGMVYSVPFFVVVSSNSPIRSVDDLIAEAKAKPGKVFYGTPFVGSPSHLGSALFASMSGTNMVNVPFKETSQLFTSVANGDITWALGTFATTRSFVEGKRVRLLAVAAGERTESNPAVPTVDEATGMKGYEVNAWIGVYARKGTPPKVLEKINADLQRALKEPDVRERMLAMGNDPRPGTIADFRTVLKADTAKYSELVKRTGITVE